MKDFPEGFSAFTTIHEEYYRPCGRVLISSQGKIRTTPRAVVVLDRALGRFQQELLSE
jgi:hypothetical protein